MESLEEKISRYADDALLYLQDADESLKAVLDMFNEFVRFLGIHINCTKSTPFPLDPQAREAAANLPFLWADQFWYLGVQVRRKLTSFFYLNLALVLVSALLQVQVMDFLTIEFFYSKWCSFQNFCTCSTITQPGYPDPFSRTLIGVLGHLSGVVLFLD